jgi:hypothetical protein
MTDRLGYRQSKAPRDDLTQSDSRSPLFRTCRESAKWALMRQLYANNSYAVTGARGCCRTAAHGADVGTAGVSRWLSHACRGDRARLPTRSIGLGSITRNPRLPGRRPRLAEGCNAELGCYGERYALDSPAAHRQGMVASARSSASLWFGGPTTAYTDGYESGALVHRRGDMANHSVSQVKVSRRPPNTVQNSVKSKLATSAQIPPN